MAMHPNAPPLLIRKDLVLSEMKNSILKARIAQLKEDKVRLKEDAEEWEGMYLPLKEVAE